jgi:AcrR family transcriptional regulator
MAPRRTDAPAATPTLQSRSRATFDALVRAGRELFAEREFDAVSVAEIAGRAGVSVGGFYARFTGKEALLDAIAERVLAEAAATLDRALAPRRMARAGLEDVVRAYVRTMVTQFRLHRSTIRMILRHARDGGPTRKAALRRFNDHVHGRLRALLDLRREEIAHPEPDLAINVGLFLVSAAAREGVLADALATYPIRVADERLVTELTRAYVAYLRSGDGPPRARR